MQIGAKKNWKQPDSYLTDTTIGIYLYSVCRLYKCMCINVHMCIKIGILPTSFVLPWFFFFHFTLCFEYLHVPSSAWIPEWGSFVLVFECFCAFLSVYTVPLGSVLLIAKQWTKCSPGVRSWRIASNIFLPLGSSCLLQRLKKKKKRGRGWLKKKAGSL